jgi:hypothetical protein
MQTRLAMLPRFVRVGRAYAFFFLAALFFATGFCAFAMTMTL